MLQFLWRSAWPPLIAANLFWAGNILLGRGLAGQVPPLFASLPPFRRRLAAGGPATP